MSRARASRSPACFGSTALLLAMGVACSACAPSPSALPAAAPDAPEVTRGALVYIPPAKAVASASASSEVEGDDGESDTPPDGIIPAARRAFLGEWEDRSTAGYTRFRVALVGDVPRVVSAVEHTGDHEHFTVQRSSFAHGELSWTYFVKSTGYTVRMSATRADAKEMATTWSNSGGANGTETLVRVADANGRPVAAEERGQPIE